MRVTRPSAATPAAAPASNALSWYGRGWVAVVLGVTVAGVNLVNIGRALPWRDEAATWIAGQRDVAELASMTTHVDAVHGVYYLLMMGWEKLAGTSITSLRAISALAIGMLAGLVFLLARELFDARTALWAGLLAGILPQATSAATEARSTALSCAAVTAAMLALAIAIRRDRWGWWLGWVAATVVAIHLYLYSALGFVGLLAALGWLPSRTRRRALLSGTAAALLCTPFAVKVFSQGDQLSWLSADDISIQGLTVRQFWRGDDLIGWLAFASIAVAVVISVISSSSPQRRVSTCLVLGWLVAPSLALVALTPVRPLYMPRFVSFTVGAVAIVLAFAISRTRWRWVQPVAVLAILAMCVPSYLSSREPTSKATAVKAYTALRKLAEPGDGIYHPNPDVDRPFWAFPNQTADLVQLGNQDSGNWRSSYLYEPPATPAEVAAKPSAPARIWLVARNLTADSQLESAAAEFERLGYSRQPATKLPGRLTAILVQRK